MDHLCVCVRFCVFVKVRSRPPTSTPPSSTSYWDSRVINVWIETLIGLLFNCWGLCARNCHFRGRGISSEEILQSESTHYSSQVLFMQMIDNMLLFNDDDVQICFPCWHTEDDDDDDIVLQYFLPSVQFSRRRSRVCVHFISPTRTAIQQQCATVLVWPKIDFQTPYFDLSAPTLLFSYIRRSRSLTYSLTHSPSQSK